MKFNHDIIVLHFATKHFSDQILVEENIGITLKNVLHISSNSIKFYAFSFYMYSPTLNILNLVFLCFMYSLCRSSHRCINHLILDSGDSSEVPGTLANDVFKFVLKSNYLPLKTRLSNVYFFLSILVVITPSHIFKTM